LTLAKIGRSPGSCLVIHLPILKRQWYKEVIITSILLSLYYGFQTKLTVAGTALDLSFQFYSLKIDAPNSLLIDGFLISEESIKPKIHREIKHFYIFGFKKFK